MDTKQIHEQGLINEIRLYEAICKLLAESDCTVAQMLGVLVLAKDRVKGE